MKINPNYDNNNMEIMKATKINHDKHNNNNVNHLQFLHLPTPDCLLIRIANDFQQFFQARWNELDTMLFLISYATLISQFLLANFTAWLKYYENLIILVVIIIY